jgi:preprotein translocase subunit SecG
MQTPHTDQTLAAMGTSHDDAEQHAQLKTGNFLYQAAIILAVLLFLISFWSC